MNAFALILALTVLALAPWIYAHWKLEDRRRERRRLDREGRKLHERAQWSESLRDRIDRMRTYETRRK